MPCEGCQTQFNVFRRKRSCSDCRRLYCSNCLTLGRRALCERCVIFAKRPLLRADLAPLKPKDLVFYLQSKHISTAGCVEKDELVGLIVLYAQQNQPDASPGSGGRGGAGRHFDAGDNASNSFDSLKQSCQNFFTNITDNLSDSFAAFDGSKPAGGGAGKPPRRDSRSSSSSQTTTTTAGGGAGVGAGGGDGPTHITHQPRVTTRQLPTYASRMRSESAAATSTAAAAPPPPRPGPFTSSSSSSRASSRGTSAATPSCGEAAAAAGAGASPIASCSSMAASPARLRCPEPDSAAYKSDDCECSDEELYATFTSDRVAQQAVLLALDGGGDGDREGDGSTPELASHQQGEESSHSSFEELGALGGTPTTNTTTATTTTSDESKAITDATTNTNSGSTEQWQLLDVRHLDGGQEESNDSAELATDEVTATTTTTTTAASPHCAASNGSAPPKNLPVAAEMPTPPASLPPKKVSRRRSDGYLNRRQQRPLSDEDSSPINPEEPFGLPPPPPSPSMLQRLVRLAGREEATLRSRRGPAPCERCGKNKANIRRHVERMRRHLESAQMSEREVRRELHDFLAFMEKRAQSMDCSSDTETAASSVSGGAGGGGGGATTAAGLLQRSLSVALSPTQPMAGGGPASYFDENEGIHVYALPPGYQHEAEARFINLDDYESLEELECLTVKQLKEVLMLNRVDYKGCCEKQELLDRVQRLWKNRKSMPSVEKLPTDELCKICMDAPIECIILECGHMATCTRCGKVLSECPICRQYIVRVVRFFRA